jgi:hypothetical protein
MYPGTTIAASPIDYPSREVPVPGASVLIAPA